MLWKHLIIMYRLVECAHKVKYFQFSPIQSQIADCPCSERIRCSYFLIFLWVIFSIINMLSLFLCPFYVFLCETLSYISYVNCAMQIQFINIIIIIIN